MGLGWLQTARALAVLLSTAALLTACGSESRVEKLGTRAVVIGIDGADWKVIEELAADGGMPQLMGLREAGTWGPIETLHDVPLSPVIWTSVATGKTPAKHGISWFMVDRADGTRVPVRSHNRKARAIWNLLAEANRRAVVIGWWATFPAEDVGRGMILSDALGYHGFGSTAAGGDPARKTHPAEAFAEFDALVPALQQIPYELVSRFVHLTPEEYRAERFDPGRFPRPDPSNPIHLFQMYAATAQGYTASAERVLERGDFDLAMVYFEQVDSLSHLFMKYDPPKLDWVEEEAFARYRHVVREWYRHQDELLGRLLEKIDLEETAVFVVSDHGFKSGERRILSEETVDVKRAHLDHEPEGIFVAAGPHIRAGARLAGASVLDVTPTLLYYLGHPVAKDMDGKVLDRLFVPDLVAAHPIRYVPTYEEEAAGQPLQTASEDFDAETAAATEAALRTLGYLGGGDEAGDPPAGEAREESSPEIHNNLGRIHLRTGDVEKARAEFREALALDPSNAEALLSLASIHRLEGRTADAELLVKRALRADPDSIGALSQLAEIERDRGSLDEAIRLFEEALAIDDSLPFLFLGYGDVLQRAGRFAEAENAFRTVLRLDPDSFKARYNLGVTYANQGRIAEAVAEYEKALEVDPKNPEAALAHNNLGALALERGAVDEAASRFEQAVEAAPGHLQSRYNLALTHLQRGRVEEAIEMLEVAARIDPNHEQVNVRLGLAYLEAGRGDDAYRSFVLVRRLYPRNWAAAVGLAVLHAANQREPEARRLLETAVGLGGETASDFARGYPVLANLLPDPA